MKAKSKSTHRGASAKSAKNKKVLGWKLSQEEIAFLEAIDQYKKEKGRPFPTWSEVLDILRNLGYSRKDFLGKTESKHWQTMCNDLREERDNLHLELVKVQAERDQLQKAVYSLMWDDTIDFDKEEIFALRGQKPSLEDIIAEMEAKGNDK